MDPDPLETAWTALRAEWNESEAHDRFIALAATLDRLGDAASRYRDACSDSSLAAGATQGKQKILARALAQLDSVPRDAMAHVRSKSQVAVPVAFLMLVFGVSAMLSVATHRKFFVSLPALALEILFVALLPWRRLLR